MGDGGCTRAQRRRADGRIARRTGIEKRRRGDRKIRIKLPDARKKTTGARLWWTIGGAVAGDELASSARTSWQRESSRGGQLERDDGVAAVADLWRAAAVKP